MRAEGLPGWLGQEDWARCLRAAGLTFEAASLGGWLMPDGAWQGDGAGFLLLKRAAQEGALAALGAAALRVCPGPSGLRPLSCRAVTPAQLELGEQVPLVGHLALDGADSATLVPHFVQSNTLELNLALQWRRLTRTHALAAHSMHAQQAAKLKPLLFQ